VLSPIRNGVLLKLDPDFRMQGGLHLADYDTIKFCVKCPATSFTHDLERTKCVPEEEWADDSQKKTVQLAYGQRWRQGGGDYVMTGINRDHRLESVRRPAAGQTHRIGTVLAIGPRCRSVNPGDRVMVGLTAGGSIDDVRVVKEDVILGIVEDEG